MPFIPITAVYSVLMVLVMLYFASNRPNSSHDNRSKPNEESIHLNFPTVTLILIILMCFAELNGSQSYLLHISGIALLALTAVNILQYKISLLYGHFFNLVMHYGFTVIASYLGLINLYLCWPYFIQC